MTKEEYKNAIMELKEDLRQKIYSVMKTYAHCNHNYKVGDIIEDHIGKVRIESFHISNYGEYPDPMFYGIELKKDGTERKRLSKRYVHFSNVIYKKVVDNAE